MAKVDEVFAKQGHDIITIDSASVYEKAGEYRRFTYVEGLKGYVLEWAGSIAEARSGVFEDGDLYPVSLGEDAMLVALGEDLIKYA